MTKEELIAGLNLLGAVPRHNFSNGFEIYTDTHVLTIDIDTHYSNVRYMRKIYIETTYKDLLIRLGKDIANDKR